MFDRSVCLCFSTANASLVVNSMVNGIFQNENHPSVVVSHSNTIDTGIMQPWTIP